MSCASPVRVRGPNCCGKSLRHMPYSSVGNVLMSYRLLRREKPERNITRRVTNSDMNSGFPGALRRPELQTVHVHPEGISEGRNNYRIYGTHHLLSACMLWECTAQILGSDSASDIQLSARRQGLFRRTPAESTLRLGTVTPYVLESSCRHPR